MRLFHFSDDPSIRSFIPRAPAILPRREQGLEWLNDPLVWAIEAWHQPMYLFPRDCPPILVWPTKDTTAHDRAAWTGGNARMIAYIERDWLAALESAHVLRYEFPPQSFEMLDDAGMWISRTTVQPLSVTRIGNLPETLREKGSTCVRKIASHRCAACGTRPCTQAASGCEMPGPGPTPNPESAGAPPYFTTMQFSPATFRRPQSVEALAALPAPARRR